MRDPAEDYDRPGRPQRPSHVDLGVSGGWKLTRYALTLHYARLLPRVKGVAGLRYWQRIGTLVWLLALVRLTKTQPLAARAASHVSTKPFFISFDFTVPTA